MTNQRRAREQHHAQSSAATEWFEQQRETFEELQAHEERMEFSKLLFIEVAFNDPRRKVCRGCGSFWCLHPVAPAYTCPGPPPPTI